jgi:hypothetical protein
VSSYQAVYDAAFKQFDISYIIPRAQEAINFVEMQMTRPSVLFKPKLEFDGNIWIACYGENLQEGCVGCGESPELAMLNFDQAWNTKRAK